MVNPVSKFLQKRVKNKKQTVELAIQKIFSVEDLDPVVAQLAVKQDMILLFWNAIKYNLNVWDFSPVTINQGDSVEEDLANTLSFK